ncbi:S-methyl-5'-thioadenosine phosphorylase [Streptosporangium sandarakinum]|uniref:S-methyl-5'-thioadenosine phosphorylase n=1 Tax=Streptosporangium sandarakinum TaxID=1260955 RepID=UPI0036A5C8F2
MTDVSADIGIIGGSGLYAFFDGAPEYPVRTPYGPPSEAVTVGRVGGRTVAFLPRHGRDHRYPPHRIPYRANIWALHALGVRQIIAPCAVGGLQPHLRAGSLVVPDQVVDRTTGREQTFYDRGAVHVPFADPYCPVGRSAVLRAAGASGGFTGEAVVDGGTMVVIEGARFSSRAESQWYVEQGWSLVNMTGLPEATLAREKALCYTAISLVTDRDAGVRGEAGVSQDEVFRVFAENITRLRTVLAAVVEALPVERSCPCADALDGIKMPEEDR